MAIITPHMEFARSAKDAREIIAQIRTETRLNRDAVAEGRKAIVECRTMLRSGGVRTDERHSLKKRPGVSRAFRNEEK